MHARLRALAVPLLLAACGPAPVRLAVPPASPGQAIPIAFAGIEVRDASFPAYAEDDAIYVQEAGALSPAAGALWADEPPRAFTLDLARALGEATGARIAPEPWPFQDPPDAELDVRVAEFVADASGQFVLRGQYFVASQDGSGRDRAREFRVAIPYDPAGGPAAIATARGQATAALAQEIAAQGLR